MSRLDPGREDGLTLVELLITMVLMTVVGAILVLTILQGSRSTVRAQEHAEAIGDIQLALERVSREIRAADPLTLADDDAVEMQILRDGETREIAYSLSAGDLVEERTVGAVTSSTTLAEDVTVFALEYFDADGDLISAPVAAGSLGSIVRVRVRIERFIPAPAQPIDVETTVHVRNST